MIACWEHCFWILKSIQDWQCPITAKSCQNFTLMKDCTFWISQLCFLWLQSVIYIKHKFNWINVENTKCVEKLAMFIHRRNVNNVSVRAMISELSLWQIIGSQISRAISDTCDIVWYLNKRQFCYMQSLSVKILASGRSKILLTHLIAYFIYHQLSSIQCDEIPQ